MRLNNKNKVILVDLNDRPIGIADKKEAHRKGLLHRSVSVFIFNQQGEWLLQKRTAFKFHSGGLWSNTCSTHPAPEETTEQTAHRRLREEMGIDCPLTELFSFIYQTYIGKGLTEYEYIHVYAGYCNAIPDVDPTEVWDWKFLPLSLIKTDEKIHPERYTDWFRYIYTRVTFNTSNVH